MQREMLRPVVFLALIWTAAASSANTGLLRDVTSSVFGANADLELLPLAFGDFNSDRRTDLFVTDDERNRIIVLLASTQDAFTIAAEEKYFSNAFDAKKAGQICSFDTDDVIAAAPADFDGDGGMDVAVITKNMTENELLTIYILWGDHDESSKRHALLCPNKGSSVQIVMTAQPLVIDKDGDNVADLYGETKTANGTISRGIWSFSKGKRRSPHFIILDSGEQGSFRYPHSNAFMDLNSDGNADLFVTGKSGFQLWENVCRDDHCNFIKRQEIRYPHCRENSGGDAGDCAGQAAFADFDLDGRLDVIFPACDDRDCRKGGNTIYFAPVIELIGGSRKDFLSVPIQLVEEWEFDGKKPEENEPYDGLVPRVGDINLDGYPDLMLRMRHRETGNTQMQVLLNVQSDSSPHLFKRGFLLQPEVMTGVEDTVVSAFYDLYEDGMEDMLAVHKRKGNKYEIAAYVNATQDSDAYFVKVIVLSGICYHDDCHGGVSVPYGTNLPGQTICYRMQRPLEETFAEIQSCAAQLPQTAHHALQLPYHIFGLGLAPNFLDFMYVNVSKKYKSWPQIIPNSQMYVIPHPPSQPYFWEAKLFITPGRSITLTGLALVGTCGLCTAIILLLHWRERRQDRMEKMQQPNQFHFDAM